MNTNQAVSIKHHTLFSLMNVEAAGEVCMCIYYLDNRPDFPERAVESTL